MARLADYLLRVSGLNFQRIIMFKVLLTVLGKESRCGCKAGEQQAAPQGRRAQTCTYKRHGVPGAETSRCPVPI